MQNLTPENIYEVFTQMKTLLDDANEPPPEYNYFFSTNEIEAGKQEGIIVEKDNRLWFKGITADVSDSGVIPGAPAGWVYETKPIPTE